MIDEKYKDLAISVETGVEGLKRTGIQVLALRDRYAKLLMPLTGNDNHLGTMYAGSFFAIGEAAGGVIHGASLDRSRFLPIVVEISIRFRRPARTDVTLEVELSQEETDRIQWEAEQKGKASFTLDLEIKDANGETVSLVRGTWQARKIPTDMENPFAANKRPGQEGGIS